MKTINYTGTSKLISRIVHLLNRKAPLPLDGDGDAVWGTNGQVLTTDGNGNTSWTTPQGGGGDVTDVEVNGTSVVNAQGVAEVTVPTNTSDLNNDSGFITNLVNDLANYYTKSQTYTQAEVNALISGIVTLNILVVQTLPTQDISTTTIYLVPKQDVGTSDIYDEYLYINNAWELIGTTQIDLSNYVTTTDLSTALADYVTSVGLATILADYVQSSDLAAVATSGSYNDLSNKPTIPTAASDITYDNTQSGLSATRVQGAIDAVEGQIANSSDAYSSSKAYAVGDYCIYNDTLYRCVTACSAASWSVNSGCFTAISLVSIVNHFNYANLQEVSMSMGGLQNMEIRFTNSPTALTRLWINMYGISLQTSSDNGATWTNVWTK